ncbi:hypothetical protein PHYC_02219 [Phycisphaerales bacterium]|nr:hypothetical protein PHYC_02219 [Phycisphaerales bacterium]
MNKPTKPRRSIPVRTIQAVLGGRPIRLDGSHEESVTPGLLRTAFHMVHLLLVGIRRSHLTRMAAALSYRTMFGIIPVIVVVAVALAAFTSQDTQQRSIKQLLTYVGLDTIKVETPPSNPGVPDLGVPPTATPPAKPDSSSLDAWINERAMDIAAKIKGIKLGMIGFIAILTLIYAAVSMLVEIEQSFNDVYNAPEGRSWARRVVQYWTLLTLGPILLVASFTITHSLNDSAQKQLGGESFLFDVVRFLGAAGVSTILLFVIYSIVPNTRVQIAPAFLGATVAGILWESGKLGFGRYVGFATSPGSTTNYGSLYGAVAILPLFLIWVYLSWLIVLFGLQLAYSMQTYRQATARGLTRSVLATLGLIEEMHPAGRPRLIDPSAMLSVLACVAGRFREGKPSDHNQVAEATGVDEQAVGEMLERLTAGGILLRVVGGPERLSTYALARPPEKISASDALRLGEELAGPKPGVSVPTTVTRLIGHARHEALSGKTVADLLELPSTLEPPGNGRIPQVQGDPAHPAPRPT